MENAQGPLKYMSPLGKNSKRELKEGTIDEERVASSRLQEGKRNFRETLKEIVGDSTSGLRGTTDQLTRLQ